MSVTSLFQQALAAIANDPDAILQDMSSMLAVDTSFPPGMGYGAFADLMESLLAPMGFRFQRVSVPESLWRSPDGSARGERVNLLATLPGDATENCNLYFHVDTVPPRRWLALPAVSAESGR
ncbi:hypothetical protein OS42_34720 [Dickeya oryzae]